MIFAVLALLTAATIAVLVYPLLRRPRDEQTRAAYDMEVHRDQLAEIERDLARGTIGAEEARAARAEIGRRMLTLANEPAVAAPTGGNFRIVAVAMAIALPTVAGALYLGRGAPGVPGTTLAERRAEAPQEAAQDKQLVEFMRAMQTRVERNPEDLEAWVRLAQASAAFNLVQEALAAWRMADKLAGEPPEIAGPLGEAAVIAANGQVTPEAERAFARVRAADPGDPRARFYSGLARAQAGERDAAVRVWFDLVAASPPDAPWLMTVREAMTNAARDARIDLARLSPSPGNPPAVVRIGPPQVASGAQPALPPGGEGLMALPEGERQQAIRTMVEGLAARLDAQPDDLDGWLRVARAWQVLDEPEKALAAHARAATIAPDRDDVLDGYGDALMAMHDQDTRLPAAARGAMLALVERIPNHAVGLWLLGQDEALAGNNLAASALWQRLLALLPDGTPARAELVQRIEKLKSAN
jgi:cytochrome c-type biogenesis protein CcmH